MKRFNRSREENTNMLFKIKCSHITVLNLHSYQYEKIEKDELIVMFYSHAMIDLYDHKKHKNSSYLINNKILHRTKIYELRFTDYNLNMNSCKENFIKSTLKNKWLDWFEKV